MAIIKEYQYKDIKKMYSEEKTMLEISKHFNVSINAIVYAMRKANIPRRSMSKVQEVRFKRKPSSFHVREIKSEKEKRIILSGLMLYWAEGYKTPKSNCVDFANSDPCMIFAFVKFLKTCYVLDEKRLRIQLYCHSNQNIEKLINFWSKLTNIPEKQFSKPYIRKDFDVNKRQMQYGLIHVRYSDKKLIFDILSRIDNLKKELCVGGGVVYHRSL